MPPLLRIILPAALALVAANVPVCVVAAPVDTHSSAPCPTMTPLFGLMPILMWLGVLPSPVIAAKVADNDTSTSIVIRPDPNDQIACGRTPVKTIKDVVFTTRTLPGGKQMDLLMDVQVPQTAARKALVVYVTGGGFIQAPKESALNLRTYVAEAGFVVASVQYRTNSVGANYRDGVADIKSAVRFLRANADKYGIDPKRIAVWGESAGGYLVAMVGVTNSLKAFDVGNNLDQSSDVQAVVDKFGASDTSRLSADFDLQAREASDTKDNPIAKYIGLDPTSHRLDAHIAATVANPVTYVARSDPPFLIFHGSQDKLISPSQTLILHNALTSAGVRSTRYVLEGAGHGDLAFLGDSKAGLPWSTNQTMGLIVSFLRESLRDSGDRSLVIGPTLPCTSRQASVEPHCAGRQPEQKRGES